MSLHTKRRLGLLAALLKLAAAVAVVLFFACGPKVISSLNGIETRERVALRDRLVDRHGVVFLASLDEAVPQDAATAVAVSFWNTPRVAGKFGTARRIKDANDSVLRQPQSPLTVAMRCATYAAWIRPDETGYRQRVFDMRSADAGFSVDVGGGTVFVAVVQNKGKSETRSSFEFKGGHGFTHIAAVVGEDYAAFYQNGREEWRTALKDGAVVPGRPLVFGAPQHAPFKGDIDDVAIWRRALSEREVMAVAKSRRPLLAQLEPWLSAGISACDKATSAISAFYRVFDRLLPCSGGPAVLRPEIPTVTIRMPNSAERHFRKAHEESLRFGFRTRRAANFRPATIVSEARLVRAELALDDVYGIVKGARREAYVLRDCSRNLVGGSGLMRLYPPELHLALHPDAPRPLPLNARFVKFCVGNSFKGLYVAEPFDGIGSAWMARGPRDPGFRRAIGFKGPPAPCDVPPAGRTIDEAYAATASIVLSDVQFPWSRVELRARRRLLAIRRADLRFHDGADPAAIALRQLTADSPSPMYVTGDLRMDLPGVVSLKSSDASLVSPDGKVSRPADGAPRAVEISTVMADGSEGAPMRIRVAPAKPTVQALFLHLQTPVLKMRRSDFSCLRFPAGGGEPQWLTGTGASGGGVKHRGNTSYVRGVKRSMSLEFDEKVAWPGVSRPATHVILYSGYADPTRLRNKISFDTFLATANGAAPHFAPDVTWAEVFVNGEYFGLWETSRRVKDLCDEGTLLYKVRARDPMLWADGKIEMTECTTPLASDSGDRFAPLRQIFAFVAHSTKAEFAAKAPSLFWLDSLVDFMLVLKFSENLDGQVTNQYIARLPGDGRWFIVPWDYDKTFFVDDREDKSLSNFLLDKLTRCIPGFSGKVGARWRELRAGPLSDKTVFGRIDADAALLAPYMEEEFRLLQPAGEDGDFGDSVRKLKASVARRLRQMDSRFAKQ